MPLIRPGVLVGVEATGHEHVTLVEFLLARGCAVVLVDPYQAAQFRRAQGAKAKTDRIDARALAPLRGRHQAAAGAPDPHPRLVEPRPTARNALPGALDLAFAELLTIFKPRRSRTVLGLLAAFATAAAVAAASLEQLTACLRQVGAGRPRRGQLAARVEAACSRSAAERLEAALSVKGPGAGPAGPGPRPRARRPRAGHRRGVRRAWPRGRPLPGRQRRRPGLAGG